ncbi:hypothetical protein F2Q69_00057182 [Brassica cretica]|uniref:Protein kinase domain-containing protein n=1 Tax=Brassica cretica TaxID=69181 RepID=A0A8S9N6A8_BRACR|nr:hypothetical protein F2Q69_00057182 [Brassica cretica]
MLATSKNEDAVLKATDFGLSVFIEEVHNSMLQNRGFASFRVGKAYRDVVGSAFYVAPEELRGSYSKEISIWSALIVLYLCGLVIAESLPEEEMKGLKTMLA